MSTFHPSRSRMPAETPSSGSPVLVEPSTSSTRSKSIGFSRRITWVLAALAALLAAGGLWASLGSSREPIESRLERAQRVKTVLSEPYVVEGKYRSMTGPWSSQEIRLDGSEAPRKAAAFPTSGVTWITGYRATMVGQDGESPMAQEFMCHSNLDIDISEHRRALGRVGPSFSPRLFTLSQGQLEIDFPPGFGIPVRLGQELDLTTQVLNLNHEIQSEAERFAVRHRVSVDYVFDHEVGPGMVPLLPIAAYGLALTEGDDGYFGVEDPDREKHGPGCLVEQSASDHDYSDGLGRSFTGHWQVPPGRQENRTLVTHLMRVPYETTVHYIAVHLHPFAESLTLRDLTTDEVIFESRAENYTDKIGLVAVDALSSTDGIAVYPDHEYELVSVYQNTTDEVQDSMAVMYIYLRDLEMEAHLRKILADAARG
ncbi:MAG: hypothetical protein MI919_42430 [Holophagales bacterium]|nr:hypothetical protein [Holophagales bacterium]